VNHRLTTTPDLVIGDDYMRRWRLLPRNPICNIYLHHFLHSDDDRALHDHPWPSLSMVIEGQTGEIYGDIVPLRYDRYTGDKFRLLRAGDIVYRPASWKHRIVIGHDETAVTLFVVGPRIRQWGFWCPQGWRHWRDYCEPNDEGRIGRGCE
jgi:hypothetical protein